MEFDDKGLFETYRFFGICCFIQEDGVGYEFDLYVGNSLINLYCDFVRMGDAQKVFDGMFERDVFSWTSLVGGYAKQWEMDRAYEIFKYKTLITLFFLFNF